jgi:hypothetical protein
VDHSYFEKQEIMKHVQLALREDFIENDEPIEYALLKYSFRASAGRGHCTSLARGGLVDLFLAKLADQVMNLQHIFLIMQVLANLAREDENHELFLKDDGFVSIASKTVFRDLPLRREETMATRAFYLKKSTRSSSLIARASGRGGGGDGGGDGAGVDEHPGGEFEKSSEAGALSIELEVLRKFAQVSPRVVRIAVPAFPPSQ